MNGSLKMIGIGADGKQSLLPMYQKWIYESDLLVGGVRQLAFFPDFHNEKQVIKGGLSSLIADLKEHSNKNIVILASGDPLFFGLGSFLSSKLNIEIYPNLSSIQLAFAKIQEKWHDAYFTSVHGRRFHGLIQRIDGRDKVVILTDRENTPAKLASYLRSFSVTEYKAFVAEDLGSETERSGWFELDEMEATTFSPLNIVILKKISEGPKWSFGINDAEFFQRKPEKGLITKKEIRALSLSELSLQKDSIVWDIGTCTGSMAIEAARLSPEGAVYAIEKNQADLENCYKNLKKFRVDVTVVHGKAPEHINEFPDPNAIFIGGTAGNLEEILAHCCKKLKSRGKIVLNAVTIETLTEAMNVLKKCGLKTAVTLAQISRSKDILHLTRFEPLNPIYIIVAEKKEGEYE